MTDREPGFESEPFPDAPVPEPSPAPETPEAPAAPTAPASPAPLARDASALPPTAFPPTLPPPPAVPPPPPGSAWAPPGPVPPYPIVPQAAPQVGYAGFWIRFLAWLIDAILLWVASLGTHVLVRVSAGVPPFPLWSRFPSGPPTLACADVFVSVAIHWLYFALLESSAAQATLGKQALRLRVTDMWGRRISFARATGRYFAKFVSTAILFVGFLMIAFTRRRQGLHDMMAETVVLRDLGYR